MHGSSTVYKFKCDEDGFVYYKQVLIDGLGRTLYHEAGLAG